MVCLTMNWEWKSLNHLCWRKHRLWHLLVSQVPNQNLEISAIRTSNFVYSTPLSRICTIPSLKFRRARLNEWLFELSVLRWKILKGCIIQSRQTHKSARLTVRAEHRWILSVTNCSNILFRNWEKFRSIANLRAPSKLCEIFDLLQTCHVWPSWRQN